MGMSVDSGSGLTNEPNLVPMIDVLLVLLVIFMLMVPMNRKVIRLQLPDPTPSTNAPTEQSTIVLEVIPGEEYRINTEPVRKEGLEERLRQIYDPRPDKVIFVKGDPTVTYQDVMIAMDIARGAGVRVIGIPPKDDKAAGGAGG